MGGGLAINGRRNRKCAGRAAVEIAVFVGNAGGDSQRAEQRVVKLSGNLEVIHTKHHMTEHDFLRWGLQWAGVGTKRNRADIATRRMPLDSGLPPADQPLT